MTEIWDENLIWAKYHLSVVERLINEFTIYSEKKFTTAIINELAISSSYLVNAYLIYSKNKYNIFISPKANDRLEMLRKQIKNKVLNNEDYETMIKIINVKKSQKKSPIQYQKNEKTLLLIDGKYITFSNNDFKKLAEKLTTAIKNFPNN